jgi:hypothetical protein
MATISLGKAPKNFKKPVTFKMLDGTDGAIECLFKYRTVSAYGAMKDELSKGAGLASDVTWAQIMEQRRDKGGEFLAMVLDGWNLDIAFDTAGLQQLADEFPGAVSAIAETYEAAIVQGRLGN